MTTVLSFIAGVCVGILIPEMLRKAKEFVVSRWNALRKKKRSTMPAPVFAFDTSSRQYRNFEKYSDPKYNLVLLAFNRETGEVQLLDNCFWRDQCDL